MLEIVEQQHDGVCVASLLGKLDADRVPLFEEWNNRRNDGAEKRIILDFSGLTYLSSAGLRAILTANRHAERTGTVLLFCGLGGMTRQVFQTAGLLAYLPVYPGVKEALEAK